MFEEVYGHERPRWFAGDGVAQHDHYSFRRNVVHERVGAEVAAVRSAAGLMDITAFTKVEVAGSEAAAFIDTLLPNRLPASAGRIVLSHLLSEQGRIEIEITCVRLEAERFYLVCAAFFEQRLLDYLHQHREQYLRQPDVLSTAVDAINIINRSSTWGALALNGPQARRILGRCTDTCLLYTSPSPRDGLLSRMPSSA